MAQRPADPQSSPSLTPAIALLRSPQTIRARCGQIFDLAQADQLQYFRCNLTQLAETAAYVIQVMRATYPDLVIPFHSRWRHFEGGDRLDRFEEQLADYSALEKARSKIDLAITSVLLDAGAGPDWSYTEPGTGQIFRRSEGLAIASFDLFCQGAFSSDPNCPYQADAQGLRKVTESDLAAGFQVNATNPLVGVAGRCSLLNRLGETLTAYPHLFGTEPPRLGNLVDYYLRQSQSQPELRQSTGQTTANCLSASTVLAAVLEGLGEIWPGRVAIANINLGDVWPHPQLPDCGIGSQLVPFHKLSQWLTYSLLEPLQELGLTITDLDALTGLPEYRNGGLCLDLGLLQVKQPEIKTRWHPPDSTVIVEWRALTVVLLDQIAAEIRHQLGVAPAELPLARILQGGTWSAGRRIAAELRPGGPPPLQIESDGTVF